MLTPLPDSRIDDLLCRLSRHAPLLAVLILASLNAIELARVAVALWVGPGPGAFAGSASTPVTQTRPAPGIDLQRIVEAHLFGVANQDPASAPMTAANLVLAGTIAKQQPGDGLAFIVNAGACKVYAVGEDVGDASLHSVYRDRVILERAGRLETLAMPHVALNGSLGQLAAEPNVLRSVMRTVKLYDDNTGKMRGLAVYPVTEGAALGRLGLSPGDLVTAINGTLLDDPRRSQELFEANLGTRRAAVTIEREGKTLNIALNVAAALSELERERASEGQPAAADGSI